MKQQSIIGVLEGKRCVIILLNDEMYPLIMILIQKGKEKYSEIGKWALGVKL